jgi:hypothetical protein
MSRCLLQEALHSRQCLEIAHGKRRAENEAFAKTKFFPMVTCEGQEANRQEETHSLQSIAFDLLSVTST